MEAENQLSRQSRRVFLVITAKGFGIGDRALKGRAAPDQAVSFLLDTNVISELAKQAPDENVVAWLAGADEDQVFLSVVSLAELRRGVELLSPGRRRNRLETWLAEDLIERFEGRVLDVDSPTADAWGQIMARSQKAGQMLAAMDGFFAATAEVHGLTLVTRNTRDFECVEIAIHNPWSA
jgi:toxin FitB